MTFRLGDEVRLSMAWETPPRVAGHPGVVLPYRQRARVVGHLEREHISVVFFDIPPAYFEYADRAGREFLRGTFRVPAEFLEHAKGSRD